MCFCFQRQNIFEDTFTDTERKTHKHTHLQNMPEIVIANLPTLCFLYFVISGHLGTYRKPDTRLVDRSKYMGYQGAKSFFFREMKGAATINSKKKIEERKGFYFSRKKGTYTYKLKK